MNWATETTVAMIVEKRIFKEALEYSVMDLCKE